MLGEVLPTGDRPHPCSLQGAQPYLASWKRKGAELGQRSGTLPQEAGEARKWGLSYQLLSQGKRGSSQAEAEPRSRGGDLGAHEVASCGCWGPGRQAARTGGGAFPLSSAASIYSQ